MSNPALFPSSACTDCVTALQSSRDGLALPPPCLSHHVPGPHCLSASPGKPRVLRHGRAHIPGARTHPRCPPVPSASRPKGGKAWAGLSQVPAGRVPASLPGAAGSCSTGRKEDGVQDQRGAAAGEEHRGPVLSLRVQRGEHTVRGLRGQLWPWLCGGLGSSDARPWPGSLLCTSAAPFLLSGRGL